MIGSTSVLNAAQLSCVLHESVLVLMQGARRIICTTLFPYDALGEYDWLRIPMENLEERQTMRERNNSVDDTACQGNIGLWPGSSAMTALEGGGIVQKKLICAAKANNSQSDSQVFPQNMNLQRVFAWKTRWLGKYHPVPYRGLHIGLRGIFFQYKLQKNMSQTQDLARQSVFICGVLSGIGCAYSGVFSVFCGILIGIFIKWSTVCDTDMEVLLSRIKSWFRITNKLLREQESTMGKHIQ
jgi:hypothetical protein